MVKAIGGGEPKMMMAFGAWIGAFFYQAQALKIILWAWVVGVLLGGVVGLGMMFFRGRTREHFANARMILSSVLAPQGDKGIHSVNVGLRKKDPLPYGVPLGIGLVSYLAFLGSTGQLYPMR